jgi:hypothetical protein
MKASRRRSVHLFRRRHLVFACRRHQLSRAIHGTLPPDLVVEEWPRLQAKGSRADAATDADIAQQVPLNHASSERRPSRVADRDARSESRHAAPRQIVGMLPARREAAHDRHCLLLLRTNPGAG